MREILIISGKGGTGKTSLTAAFAHLAAGQQTIICDLDVDAPDLHLLLTPHHISEHAFHAGNEAVIDPDNCSRCGICVDMCRYRAISRQNGQFIVDPIRCEGCKVCVTFCPEETISFPEKHCGTWYTSSTRFGPMVHARLFPGEENSGRLVTLLRQEAKKTARQKNLELLISDGAPGIGCPVISSLSGVDAVVLVTEPTPSGRHDLERVARLCDHFRIKTGIIVNKADINKDATEKIAAYCRTKGYPLLARLPYDPVITEAMVQQKAVTEFTETEISRAIAAAWRAVLEKL